MIVRRLGCAPSRRTAVTAYAGTGGGLSVEVTFPAVPNEPPAATPATR
jgi:hypothetical protein